MLTLLGPPDRTSADGWRATTSAAVMRLGTISEKTSSPPGGRSAGRTGRRSRRRGRGRSDQWRMGGHLRRSYAANGGRGCFRAAAAGRTGACVSRPRAVVVVAMVTMVLAAGPLAGRRRSRSTRRATTATDNPFFPDDTTVNVSDCVSACRDPSAGAGTRRMAPRCRLRRGRRRLVAIAVRSDRRPPS